MVLRGCYNEWFHDEPLEVLDGRYKVTSTFRNEGAIVSRKGDVPHRISLIDGKPVTTMVFTGPEWRKWGFHTPLGWVPWREFDQRMDEGTYKGTDE
jgi:hypothetical protein